MSRCKIGSLGLLGLLGCPRAPEQVQAQVQVLEPAPVCGRLVLVETDAEERSRVAIMPAAGGAIEAVLGDSDGLIDEQGSSFPALVSPDARTLLVLGSRAHGESKTRDRFELVDLTGNLDAARPLDLEPAEQQLRSPDWAPDGSWLVYESDAHSFRDLYRVELGSGSVLRLTDDPEGNFEPAISPDGQQIAFVSSRDGDAELYSMTADGGAPQRLTTSPGDDTAPRWSPDGSTLVFASGRERERGIDLFVLVVGAGGDRRARPLVRDGSRTSPVIAGAPVFSPDGSRLAFSEGSPSRGIAAIVIVDVAAGEVIARIATEAVDEQPTWSPDGRLLAFARGRGDRSDIVRVRADGSELEVLTDGAGQRWLPRWVADPGCVRAGPAVAVEPPAGRG